MLDVFKARLKAKTKAAGVNLSQKRIDAFADRLHKKNPDTKEEADHDKLIEELDELVQFKDVAKEDDRVRTLEARSKTQDTPDDTEEDQDDSEPAKGSKKTTKKKEDEVPAWAKTMMDEFKTLKTEKTQSTIREKLSAKLKGTDGKTKVPEKFYSKRALPEKEEDLDQFIEEVENDWKELQQESNNTLLSGSSAPAGGAGVKATGKEEDAIKQWAQAKAPATEQAKK
jgi:hypothetical protein